jgi:hypothetical protein
VEKVQSLAEFLGVLDPQADAPAESSFSPDITPQSAEDFCQGVLSSREYRESVYRRITMDDLPPSIEQMFYAYACGKPVEKIEVTDKTAIENMTVEQLEERALALVSLARKMRKAQAGQPVEDEPSEPLEAEGVH